jgi:hypothetical protein
MTLYPLKLSWKPPTDRPSRILGYRVTWAGETTAGSLPTRSCKARLMLPPGKYKLTVRALYAEGDGEAAELNVEVVEYAS